MTPTSREHSSKRVGKVALPLVLCGAIGVGLFGAVAEPKGGVGRSGVATGLGSAGAAPVPLPTGRVVPPTGFPEGHPWLPELKPGARVQGWVVDSIHTPSSRDGDLAVRFSREGVSVTVFVAPKGSTGFNAPTSTEHYDLFVNQNPSDAELEGATRTDLLSFVADQVREAEARGALVRPSYRPHG